MADVEKPKNSPEREIKLTELEKHQIQSTFSVIGALERRSEVNAVISKAIDEAYESETKPEERKEYKEFMEKNPKNLHARFRMLGEKLLLKDKELTPVQRAKAKHPRYREVILLGLSLQRLEPLLSKYPDKKMRDRIADIIEDAYEGNISGEVEEWEFNPKAPIPPKENPLEEAV